MGVLKEKLFDRRFCVFSEKDPVIELIHKEILSSAGLRHDLVFSRSFTAQSGRRYGRSSGYTVGEDENPYILGKLDAVGETAARHMFVDTVCVGKKATGYYAECDAFRELMKKNAKPEDIILVSGSSARIKRLAREAGYMKYKVEYAVDKPNTKKCGILLTDCGIPQDVEYRKMFSVGEYLSVTDPEEDNIISRTDLEIYKAMRIEQIWRFLAFTSDEKERLIKSLKDKITHMQERKI